MNLDEIEALEKNATKGPWVLEEETSGDEYDGSYRVFISPKEENKTYSEDMICDQIYYNSAPNRIEDARFIASARDFVPWACKRIRTLEAVAEAAKKSTCCTPSQELYSALKKLEKP